MDIAGMQQKLEILAGATPAGWPSFYEELKHFLTCAWLVDDRDRLFDPADDQLYLLRCPPLRDPETDGPAENFWKRWAALGEDAPKAMLMLRDLHGDHSQRMDASPSAIAPMSRPITRNGMYCTETHYVLQYSNCQRLRGRQDITYRVVAAMPGVGTTGLPQELLTSLKLGKFSKAEEFPDNLLGSIKTALAKSSTCVRTSSHGKIRKALTEDGMPYILAYPSIECKAEHLQRYRDGGASQEFQEFMQINFESHIEKHMRQAGCEHLVLQSGQQLQDVLRLNLNTGGFVITQT